MSGATEKLCDDAQRIWRAGVEAVRPAALIPQYVEVVGSTLRVGDQELRLAEVDRLVIVGAGKAGASMTQAVEAALGDAVLRAQQVTGWVNVPADCVAPARSVHLHAARPAGVNEPTPAGVEGTREILRLVGGLGPRDLCLCLISGGGSALLPAPLDGLDWADKAEITRAVAAAGGTITQLNTVRRALSRVKGGGLARACRAGQLISLILSDVPGDDLETIASGPTVLCPPQPAAAVQVLHDLGLPAVPAVQRALHVLGRLTPQEVPVATCRVRNILIGNNALAVDAAGCEAERLGYRHAMISATEPEGAAEHVGQHLARMADTMRTAAGPDCLISGGEPIVELAPAAVRGWGGRNQQLALAALVQLADWQDIALLSGGTDGEDGPTDAAGAIVSQRIQQQARRQGLNPAEYLQRNDAYHFFESCGGLLKTGPTHTNVCDLRVVVTQQQPAPSAQRL